MQSRKISFIESLINVLIGYSVSIISQLIVFPLFKIDIPFSSNLGIGICFTFLSIIRSYLTRRFFNKIESSRMYGVSGSFIEKLTMYCNGVYAKVCVFLGINPHSCDDI